jgi:nucleoside-diphosphate-sugar epimerase
MSTAANRLFFLLALSIGRCLSFGDFQMPKFPSFGNNGGGTGAKSTNGGVLQPGDTVAVIGASGNVGKLVALRLSDTYKVNGIVRDADSVKSFFEGREKSISLFETDLLEEVTATLNANDDDGSKKFFCPDSLYPALCNANAIVICTGTTAFPTEAWSRSGEFSVTSEVLGALVDSKFDVSQALGRLDSKGLNTPKNVDERANKLVLDAWKDASKVSRKRAIMLSSIGVTRRETIPFPILNACGVLSAKAAGEQALQEAAAEDGFSYTILRPGQLFGGPYDNNYYLGTLFQLDKDTQTRDVDVERGDGLLGDTLRSTLAEVTAQIMEGDCARDMDFAVVNVKGDAPTAEAVKEKLVAL